MVIGCYYLTLMINNNNHIKKWFANEKEALLALSKKNYTHQF
jgi:hypothetical protein